MTTISATGSNAATVAPGASPISLAVCDMTSSLTSLSSPHGSVYFVRESSGVRVIGQFTGINGTHGLHIHTVRTCPSLLTQARPHVTTHCMHSICTV